MRLSTSLAQEMITKPNPTFYQNDSKDAIQSQRCWMLGGGVNLAPYQGHSPKPCAEITYFTYLDSNRSHTPSIKPVQKTSRLTRSEASPALSTWQQYMDSKDGLVTVLIFLGLYICLVWTDKQLWGEFRDHLSQYEIGKRHKTGGDKETNIIHETKFQG